MALPQDYVPELGVITGADGILGKTTTERLLPFELIRSERLAAEPLATPMPAEAHPTLGSPFFEGEEWQTRREQEPMLRPVASRPTVMVITTSRQRPAGSVLTEEDLYAVQIPPEFLPEGVFLSPVPVVGRTVCDHVLANEFVRASRLCD